MTHSTKEEEHTCDYCRSKMYKLPTDMYESDLDIVGKDTPLKQRIYEELVKPSPEFDQKLFDSRDGDLARRNAEISRQMKMASAFSKGADMKMILIQKKIRLKFLQLTLRQLVLQELLF